MLLLPLLLILSLCSLLSPSYAAPPRRCTLSCRLFAS